LWNSATTPFIQVTWDGTDDPMRQTVSWLGAAEEDVVPPLPELVAELQPAAASAAAAQAAAAVILSRTAGVLTSCWQGNQPACTA